MARDQASHRAVVEPPRTQLAPRQGGMTFPALLERSKSELAKYLRGPELVDRFARVALTEFRKNPELAVCTPESIMASVMDAARLNLEIGGPLRQGYLVPYKKTCAFQVSYIGLLELARRSGTFRDIDAVIVHENDTFAYERDPKPKLYHKPDLWNPGSELGAYVFAILANGEPKFLAMNRREIEKVRAQSFAANSLMWSTFWGEGAKKTVLKRFLKTQALSVELAEAIELDNRGYDLGEPALASARVAGRRGVAGLAERLQLDEPTLPPQPSAVYTEADPEDFADSGPDTTDDGTTYEREPGEDDA